MKYLFSKKIFPLALEVLILGAFVFTDLLFPKGEAVFPVPGQADPSFDRHAGSRNGPENFYRPRIVRSLAVEDYNALGYRNDLYTRPPRRVVAVGNSIIETLSALGVGDRIVFAGSYSNSYYVPEPENAAAFRSIPLEKASYLNMETVLALEPDFIVSGQVIYSRKRLKSTAFWNDRGVHTYVDENANSPTSRIHVENLDREYDFILGLGEIFNRSDRAEEIVAHCKETLRSIREKVKDRKKQKVLIVEQFGKYLVAYDDTKLAGNICVRLGAEVHRFPAGTISLEEIIRDNPDVIFVVKSGNDPRKAAVSFSQIPALECVNAVRHHRVYGIALDYTYNSNVKTESGIKQFARGLYPDLHLE